ncbi:MAG: DUF4129 domain-containing protein [Saprospiraceae bacterium]
MTALIYRILCLLLMASTCYPMLLGQSVAPSANYLEETILVKPLSSQSEENWKAETKDIIYFTEKRKKQVQEKKAPPILDDAGARALSIFILIVLGIIVVYFLLRQLLGMSQPSKNKKIAEHEGLAISLEKIEENLHEVVLSDYIQEAISAGHFVLAIRLYYLDVLKTLSSQRQIKWKRDKTNKDYLYEMQQSPFFVDFQDLTRIFEQCWYGNQPMDALTFQAIEPQFQHFMLALEPSKSSR